MTCTIELIKVVVTELEDLSELSDAAHTFFVTRSYDPSTHKRSCR